LRRLVDGGTCVGESAADSEFYAISMERNIKHPAVLAICKQAEAIFEQRS